MFNYPAVPHYMMVTDALLEFNGMTRDDLVIHKSVRGGGVSDGDRKKICEDNARSMLRLTI